MAHFRFALRQKPRLGSVRGARHGRACSQMACSGLSALCAQGAARCRFWTTRSSRDRTGALPTTPPSPTEGSSRTSRVRTPSRREPSRLAASDDVGLWPAVCAEAPYACSPGPILTNRGILESFEPENLLSDGTSGVCMGGALASVVLSQRGSGSLRHAGGRRGSRYTGLALPPVR